MNTQRWAFALFCVVAAAGAALCVKLYVSASRINDTFTSYTSHDLETVEYLSHVQSDFIDNERLIYEYYANPGQRTDLLIRIALVREDIAQSLVRLGADFKDLREFQVLTRVFEQFAGQLERMDTIMTAGRSSPGAAHRQLAELSAIGDEIGPALDSLLEVARSRAENKQAYVSRQLVEMVTLVSVFTVLAVVLFVYAGFSVYALVKNDATRKKLACFPERSPIAVFSLGEDGSVRYANPASHRMAARIAPDLETVLPGNVADIVAGLRGTPTAATVHEYSLRDHVLSATLKLLPEFGECHVYVSNVTERHRAERELQQLAYYDPVTRLPNAALFTRTCRAWITGDEDRFSLLLFSFLRFDFIARSADDAAIDELLLRATQSVRTKLQEINPRTTWEMFRLSGVNFAILVKPRGALDAVTSDVADRVQQAFAAPLRVKRREFYLSPVVSSCVCPDDAITTESLVGSARAAMDALVKRNKVGYREFDQAIRDQETNWLAIETALHKAMENHEFELHYQPKLSAERQSLSGMEALVRWRRGGRLVPPAEFIPVAEESGLILPLGDWVLNEACRQAAEWREKGGNGCAIAVNVSATQLHQPDFVDKVRAALALHHLPPGSLELELTESVLMQDIERNLPSLNALREMGVKLSLDDFGTGYSSLAYLRRLPISNLKIDRAFITNLLQAGPDQAMVRTMIEMAHLLGLRAIAEGVESEEQVKMLREMGCDEFQGYYYSRPVAAVEMVKWWRTLQVAGLRSAGGILN